MKQKPYLSFFIYFSDDSVDHNNFDMQYARPNLAYDYEEETKERVMDMYGEDELNESDVNALQLALSQHEKEKNGWNSNNNEYLLQHGTTDHLEALEMTEV